MLRGFKQWYQLQQFVPGPFGWLVNPFYHARRAIRRQLGQVLPRLVGKVLDVGCGTKPYADLVAHCEYVGMDWESSLVRQTNLADVYYDGARFPFPDASFDHVICTQVLEHVFNPAEFLSEIQRVLKPGGTLVLTVPFVWDEHEQPYDFARYSSFGLHSLLKAARLDVIEEQKLCDDARALAQLLNAWLFKITRTRSHVLNVLTTALLMAPVSLVGLLLGWLLPQNPDFFLDNFVVAKRPPVDGIKR